jgi:hypothetical protein
VHDGVRCEDGVAVNDLWRAASSRDHCRALPENCTRTRTRTRTRTSTPAAAARAARAAAAAAAATSVARTAAAVTRARFSAFLAPGPTSLQPALPPDSINIASSAASHPRYCCCCCCAPCPSSSSSSSPDTAASSSSSAAAATTTIARAAVQPPEGVAELTGEQLAHRALHEWRPRQPHVPSRRRPRGPRLVVPAAP